MNDRISKEKMLRRFKIVRGICRGGYDCVACGHDAECDAILNLIIKHGPGESLVEKPDQRISPVEDKAIAETPGPSPEDREAVERLARCIGGAFKERRDVLRMGDQTADKWRIQDNEALAHIRRRLGMEVGK